jgi:hypothetical protein
MPAAPVTAAQAPSESEPVPQQGITSAILPMSEPVEAERLDDESEESEASALDLVFAEIGA